MAEEDAEDEEAALSMLANRVSCWKEHSWARDKSGQRATVRTNVFIIAEARRTRSSAPAWPPC